MIAVATDSDRLAAQERHRREQELAIAAMLLWWDAQAPAAFTGLLTGEDWTFMPVAQVYVSRSGTVLTPARLRNLLDTLEGTAVEEFRHATDRLYEGGIDAAQWRARMGDILESQYLASAAMAAGGVTGLTDEDWAIYRGRVTPGLRSGNVMGVGYGTADADARLDRFEDEIGKMTHAAASQRASLYALGGYTLFDQVRGKSHERVADRLGLKVFAHNRLDLKAQHCQPSLFAPSCPGVTAKGWTPSAQYVTPGLRACAGSCRCHTDWRLAKDVSELEGIP